jgi:hypothetical protein
MTPMMFEFGPFPCRVTSGFNCVCPVDNGIPHSGFAPGTVDTGPGVLELKSFELNCHPFGNADSSGKSIISSDADRRDRSLFWLVVVLA